MCSLKILLEVEEKVQCWNINGRGLELGFVACLTVLSDCGCILVLN